jgi:DNA-binding NarL/FixJ family response regulator
MRKTILCIEDDRATAALIDSELTTRGYTTAPAHDGPGGLAAVLRLRPDIVLCNVRLPIMSGFELRDRLIALTPQFGSIPFIFLSEFGDHGNHFKGRHLDADACVAKPMDFDVLDTVIRECLAKVEPTRDWSPQIALNDREIECLTWAVRGKTSNEIAQIIGTIKRNVDFYIEMACRKLKVSMRIQGPVKAAHAM